MSSEAFHDCALEWDRRNAYGVGNPTTNLHWERFWRLSGFKIALPVIYVAGNSSTKLELSVTRLQVQTRQTDRRSAIWNAAQWGISYRLQCVIVVYWLQLVPLTDAIESHTTSVVIRCRLWSHFRWDLIVECRASIHWNAERYALHLRHLQQACSGIPLLQSIDLSHLIWRTLHAPRIIIVPLCVCLSLSLCLHMQGNSNGFSTNVGKILWRFWCVTCSNRLITMQTQFLNGIFATEGQGNFANFADNSRSCWLILLKSYVHMRATVVTFCSRLLILSLKSCSFIHVMIGRQDQLTAGGRWRRWEDCDWTWG